MCVGMCVNKYAFFVCVKSHQYHSKWHNRSTVAVNQGCTNGGFMENVVELTRKLIWFVFISFIHWPFTLQLATRQIKIAHLENCG